MYKKFKWLPILLLATTSVLSFAVIALVLGDVLDANINVIGIRVATLIVAFASFMSSTLFSLLILTHNRTVSKINEDNNLRGELFREQQFASSNYSVIDFMDRMLIFKESTRYIDRFVKRRSLLFHLISHDIDEAHLLSNPDEYAYFSFKIPFKVIEGKLVSKITFDQMYFERDDTRYLFLAPKHEQECRAFILFNEQTKRNNIIVNLIVKKASKFFDPTAINDFSKIKMHLRIKSLLGVSITGVYELYFTNPEQKEGDGTNTYKINSSNFEIVEMPVIEHLKKDVNA